MRGFVTLAVGDVKYYKLAANLLISYRKSNNCSSEKFAIFCDKENEYTKLFDKVIIIEKPYFSYMDKLIMLSNPPFEKNIFIDADCLIFNDANIYWDYFPKKGVSCFGQALSLESKDGWFELDNIGEYRDRVKFIPNMHGGIIFFNKDNVTKEIYELSLEVADNYDKYTFKYFEKPADEPILALCMAVFDIKPIALEKSINKKAYIFYPIAKKVMSNINKNKLSYISKDGDLVSDVILCHYQNYNTQKLQYKIEECRLHNKNVFSYIFVFIMRLYSISIKRLINKLKRMVGR